MMPNRSFISIQIVLLRFVPFAACCDRATGGLQRFSGHVLGVWLQPVDLRAGTISTEFTWSKRTPFPKLLKSFHLKL